MGTRKETRLNVGVGTLLTIAMLLHSSSASADAKSCITAHATGQREAKAGHLRLSAELFATCASDEACPSELRQECAEFFASLQQTMPTVIFTVIDEKGQDVSTVKVFSSEELITNGLDGRAIQIDPGKHRLRFLLPSGEVLSSDVLIREGEKSRQLQMRVKEESKDPVLVSEKPPLQPARVTTTPPWIPPPSSPVERRTLPASFWFFSGAAVVGLGIGATFALLGNADKNTLSGCAPSCGTEMRGTFDNMNRDYLIADVGFAMSALSAGIATWLFVSSQNEKREPSSASHSSRRAVSRVVPTYGVTKHGGILSWSGSF